MRLDGVIISREYHDFLSHSLLFNKHLFSNLVVVSASWDAKTRKVCDWHGIKCITAECLDKEFNKGKAINVGLEYLNSTDYIMHLDGDICLPPLAREILDKLPLEHDKIYGVDRFMVRSQTEWFNFLSEPSLQHEFGVYTHMDTFPVGVRIRKDELGGWGPIGYLQLFHSSMGFKYPENHSDCSRSDTSFYNMWPREKRVLIPDFLVYHLETPEHARGEMGMNWEGRKTGPFKMECGYCK